MGSARAAPRRERARAATIDEIKQTACRLMRERGSAEIHFADIARAMEMTAPALYRYFADRDELLNALIADAYDTLGRHMAQARDAESADDTGARWMAAARAYRAWANAEPERFALIFGLPLPGYVAPLDGPTTEAARRAMSQMALMFIEASERGTLRKPMMSEVDPSVEACVVVKNEDMEVTIPPESFQAMLHAWASLHGFVSLEAYGHFGWMDQKARDALFLAQARLMAQFAGLPGPN